MIIPAGHATASLEKGGATGNDDDIAREYFQNIGAKGKRTYMPNETHDDAQHQHRD